MTIAFEQPNAGTSPSFREAVNAILSADTVPGGFNPNEIPVSFLGAGDTVPSGIIAASVSTGVGDTVDASAFSNLRFVAFSGQGRVEGNLGDGAQGRVFQMSDGGSNVVFGAGPSTVVGGAGDDTIDFTSGTGFAFVGGGGNDSVSGGTGFDVVVAPRGTASFQNGKLVITGEGGWTATIDADVEFVVVGDQVLLNAGTDETAVLGRIYKGLFDGFDLGGLKFWEAEIQSGERSLLEMANNAIVGNPELQALSDDQFVQRMYELFFDRGGDADGLAFWTNALQSGQIERGALVVGFAASAEMASLTSDTIFVGGWGDQTM